MRVLLATLTLLSCGQKPPCQSISSNVVSPVVHVMERSAISLTWNVPGTRCTLPDGSLMASGTFTDSSGARQDLTITDLSLSGESVRVQFGFTTTAPGPGALRLDIEPSLARVQAEVFVAHDALARPAIELPRACPRAQRFRQGLVLCTLDGGVELLDGITTRAIIRAVREPLVVGDVLWAYQDAGADTLVSRFELSDGGLARTHVSTPLFRADTPLFSVTEQRAFSHGHFLDLADGGALSVSNVRERLDAVVFEADGVRRQIDGGWCGGATGDAGACYSNGGRLVGVEPNGWWEVTPRPVYLLFFERPIGPKSPLSAVAMTEDAVRTGQLTGLGLLAGSRRPAWQEPRSPLHFLAFFSPDAGPATIAFPSAPTQTSDFVSFAVDGGVRFIALPF